jgi:hypothetical protein
MDTNESALRLALAEAAAHDDGPLFGQFEATKAVLSDYLEEQGRYAEAAMTRAPWRRDRTAGVKHYEVWYITRLVLPEYAVLRPFFGCVNAGHILHWPPRTVLCMGLTSNRPRLWFNTIRRPRLDPKWQEADFSRLFLPAPATMPLSPGLPEGKQGGAGYAPGG